MNVHGSVQCIDQQCFIRQRPFIGFVNRHIVPIRPVDIILKDGDGERMSQVTGSSQFCEAGTVVVCVTGGIEQVTSESLSSMWYE